ncbi:MAG: insulinase family protein [Alphaproteobacteria bacterium]|nr:insulinase family protein [Alphaproteobacteria bacterium]
MAGWPARAPHAAPRIQRVVSPGGIVAWLVEDRRIPIVSLQLAFRGGAALDTEAEAGRANLATRLMTEGAGDLESLAFQRRVEDLSASLGFDDGRDTTGGWLKTLSKHKDEAFELMALALAKPRFDAAPLDRIKSGVIGRLKRNSEDPDYLAGRLWWRRVAGTHPYARPGDGTAETVTGLGADHLRRFAAERLARDNLVLGCVGDIAADELGRALDRVFGALPARATPWALPPVPVFPPGGAVLLDKAVPQSVASFGHAGPVRRDPDYYAAFVANHVLGGGSFNSRLYREVRDKRGLAYSVYSFLNPMDAGGFVQGGVATQNARLAESVALIRAEWRRMADGGVSAEELAAAKAYLTGSFPLQFDSTDRIARFLVSIQLDDLGIDFLERRNGHIEAVTADDVARVAKRVFAPDRLVFAVVGQPAGLDAARVEAVD